MADGYAKNGDRGAKSEEKEEGPKPFCFVALKEKSAKCAATLEETNKVNTQEYPFHLHCFSIFRTQFYVKFEYYSKLF